MAKRSRPYFEPSKSTAVLVRLAAFFAATVGIVLIPVILFAATSGQVTHTTAGVGLGVAFLLILLAAVIVRPFDPLRA